MQMQRENSRAAGRLRRLGWVVLVVVALNVLAWGLYGFSVTGTTSTAAYVGAGTLAFVLGMRHAFDADHIATIDDCTRLLIRRGERPIGLGLFFALGHSSVVFLLFIGVAVASASASETATHAITTVMGPISGIVAALFLLFVGLLNLRVLRRVWTARRALRGEAFGDKQIEEILNARSVMSRVFGRRMQSSMTASWKMFPLGFIFGLGLETASEIALLGLSATAATTGHLSLLSLIALPLLFAAGMTLFDTLNSVLMVSMYQSSNTRVRQRLTFNVVMTFVTATIAIGVGLIYLAGFLVRESWVSSLAPVAEMNQHFEVVGYIIVVAYGLLWTWMLLVSRERRAFRTLSPVSAASTPATRSSPDV
jgi:high-affinity nickel-transport protein